MRGYSAIQVPAMHIEMDLPESAFGALRMSPGRFVQELRLAAAVKWYEAEMISQSKAAGPAGVSREPSSWVRAASGFPPPQPLRMNWRGNSPVTESGKKA